MNRSNERESRRHRRQPEPREPRTPQDEGYDRATEQGEPVTGRAYGKDVVELETEEDDPPYTDWNGAPGAAGIGAERAWEPWSPEDEDVYEHMGGDDPEAGIRSPDLERADPLIESDIRERLDSREGIDASRVQVSVREGIAVLDGLVDGRETSHRIEEIAAETPGVQGTENRLGVRRRAETPGAADGSGASR